MRLMSLCILFTALLLFSAAISYCVPIPALDVVSLSEASDLILTGEVVKTDYGPTTAIGTSSGPVQGRYVTCVVNIHDILKGSAGGNSISFKYFLPSEPMGYASVQLGNQLIFLKKSGPEYSLTSPYYASLPATSGLHAQAGNVLSGIVMHLGAVLESSMTSHTEKQIALFALKTIKTAQATELLKRALTLQDSTLRLNAAAFLLLRNDLTGMTAAETALLNEQSVTPIIVHNLDYAISTGVKDRTAVPSLMRLAQSPNVETRRAVASALGHTGSASAVGPLVRLLPDADREVRYRAVRGLAQITGNLEWGPNMDAFESDEQKYTRYWQDWWAANNKSN